VIEMLKNPEIFALLMAFFFGGCLVGAITMWTYGWQRTLEKHKKGLDKWLAEQRPRPGGSNESNA